MLRRHFLLSNNAIGLAAWLGVSRFVAASAAEEALQVTHTDAEWRNLLTSDQYAVLRQSATERPFTAAVIMEADALQMAHDSPSNATFWMC